MSQKRRIPAAVSNRLPGASPRRGGRPSVSAGYDATVDKKRRKVPQSAIYAEDDHLTQHNRKKLNASARDLYRNFDLAAWAIRKHLDFVSSFSFQCRSGDDGLDRRIEELMRWWSRPRNCDVSGHHGFHRFFRLLEQCRLIDGDVFAMKLRSGQMQAIESDRIRRPQDGLPPADAHVELTHGIELDKAGRFRRLCVCRRGGRYAGTYHFDKWVQASNAWQHGYFSRFDQVRGVTPLSAALNRFQDLYESFDLALVKAKLHNMFGLAITRQKVDQVADFDTLDADTGDTADADTTNYRVQLSPDAPFKLELDPGDDIKFLESHQPSAEFRDFGEMMIRLTLLSCDIPYTFYDTKGSTYSGARQEMLQYYHSARNKRTDNQHLLQDVTGWKLASWVLSGLLELPRGKTLDDIQYTWIPSALPWIDPLKEVKATREAITAGLTSEIRACRELGLDYHEIMEEQRAARDLRERLGLVPEPVTVGAAPEAPKNAD